MTRSSWFTIAYALMLGAAGPLAALASQSSGPAATARVLAPELDQGAAGHGAPAEHSED